MGRPALATAYNMKGAFNDVVLSLSPEAKTGDVIASLDDLLDWYGDWFIQPQGSNVPPFLE